MQLKKYTLGELMEVTRGMSLSGEYYSAKGNLIRLTLGNFDYKNNCFKNDKSKDNLFFTGAVKPEFILSKGDIITPLTEQAVGLLGSTAKIPCSGTYIQSQDVALIKCNEKLNPQFAFYLIPSKIVRNQLSAAAQQTKIRHTSPDKIKACTVWIPEYAEQQKIAAVLSALDDKIALNSRINAKLEAMAKHLYDYWFVQFEFPFDLAQGKPDADDTFDNARPPISQAGHTSTPAGQNRTYKTGGGKMVWNEQLKREIPEGWEVKRLGDVFLEKNKTTIPGEHLRNLKYCPIDEIPMNTMSFAGGKYYTEANSSLQLYDEKDILIGAMRVYFHRCCVASRPAITRTTTIVLEPRNKNYLSYLYQICNENKTFDFAMKVSNGTQQPYVTWNALKEYKFPFPKDQNLINEFCKKTMPLVNQVLNNVQQSAKLTTLRDRLLPLLMNGQVVVE